MDDSLLSWGTEEHMCSKIAGVWTVLIFQIFAYDLSYQSKWTSENKIKWQ